MTDPNFQVALRHIIEVEGGLQTPDQASSRGDPGGETYRGITQETLRSIAYWWDGPLPDRPRDLTDEQVEKIYEVLYWKPVSRLARASPAIALMVFDAAVQHGQARAIRWLQELVGARTDGIVGEKTLRAAREKPTSWLIFRYHEHRRLFVARWATRDWRRKKILAGLLKRIGKTEEAAFLQHSAWVPKNTLFKEWWPKPGRSSG